MPFIFKHVAVMPDCHYGKGATVGTVLATKGAIIPAAVGVDIGCGMIAVKTPLHARRHRRPGGHPRRHRAAHPDERRQEQPDAHATAPPRASRSWSSSRRRDYDAIDPNWRLALGTLGGGNHFIELATDEAGAVWATLHSGSRGIGNKIGNLHIRRAQAHRRRRISVALPDRDLAYLTEGTQEFDDYIRDLLWAQQFAR